MFDLRTNAPGDNGRRPQPTDGPGDIQEGLVHAELLNAVGDFTEHGHDEPRVLRVILPVGLQDHGVWTRRTGLDKRHGGIHAECPRLVRGGQHHGSRAQTRHDHRLAPVLGCSQEFDTHVEHVHVHVQDGAAAVPVQLLSRRAVRGLRGQS